MEAADQADDGRFALTRRTDQRRHRARTRLKRDAMQHRLVRFITEANIVKHNITANLAQRYCALWIAELVHLTENFECPVKAGNSLRQLRPDIHNLEHRSNHEGKEHVVLEVIAQSELMVQHFASTQQHHQTANYAQHRSRRK